jgi:hypothetical protein
MLLAAPDPLKMATACEHYCAAAALCLSRVGSAALAQRLPAAAISSSIFGMMVPGFSLMSGLHT